MTHQMVANFEAGGAAINQLAQVQGAELSVHNLAAEGPTGDLTQGPAMDEADCVAAVARGMVAVEEGFDVLCLGEMGIGNTSAAAAVCHAVYGSEAKDWVGPGTGVAGSQLENKISVVAAGIRVNGPSITDGLAALRWVGGRELAAIAGAVLQARQLRIPVLLDGYVCCAAAACHGGMATFGEAGVSNKD